MGRIYKHKTQQQIHELELERQRKHQKWIDTYFKTTLDADGNLVYTFRCVPEKTKTQKILAMCVAHDVVQRIRSAYKQTVAIKYHDGKHHHKTMSWLAFNGLLDNHFERHVIDEANKHNVVPDGYEFHHMIPIKLGGGNTNKNLVLIQTQAHQALHMMMDWLLSVLPYQTDTVGAAKVFIEMPDFGHVIHNRDMDCFIQATQEQKREHAIKVAQHQTMLYNRKHPHERERY